MFDREQVLDYLDYLRASGIMDALNMRGACIYLEDGLCLSHYEAEAMLSEWMKTTGYQMQNDEVDGEQD